jgi:Fe-S cluster biosynthesis and repair protein YggX
MLKDGTTERTDRQDAGIYNVTNMRCFIWKRSKAPAYIGKGIEDCLNSTVWAKSEKQAIKIVNEKRLQMIANGEWK